MSRPNEINHLRNKHYSVIMRNYITLLRENNLIPNGNPDTYSLLDYERLKLLADADDSSFYRFINVAGISVRKGRISGLDGIFLGPSGNYVTDPLVCPYQKQLRDFFQAS